MKKEEPRKYAKDRMEYFREFHTVVAPVVAYWMDMSMIENMMKR